MEAHDWVVGIASHGSTILSRGRLVEANGYPRYPSSIQHNAVVNNGNTAVTFLPKFSWSQGYVARSTILTLA